MARVQILKETAITMAELASEMEKIKDRDKELSFRSQRTEEYLQQFSLVDQKKAKQLFDNISKLNVPRLKENHIAKLIDIMPKTPEDVKLVLQGYSVTINQENLKKIAKAIEEFKTE
ncbi:MAG: hypothetical protein ABIF10_03035 [Candidatus Woesearchaeota archaeon]